MTPGEFKYVELSTETPSPYTDIIEEVMNETLHNNPELIRDIERILDENPL